MLKRRLSFFEPSRPYREWQILSGISADSSVSQRALAKRAFLGPTMVNQYISDLQREGLVLVDGETNRSFRYRLTRAGSYRLQELFLELSMEIVQFYGQMKQEFHYRLRELAAEGCRRVVLFGAAETAELAWAASEGSGLQIVGIVDNDPARQKRRIGSIEVGDPGDIEELNPDTVLITSFGYADEIHEQVRHLEDRGMRVARI